MQKMSLKWKKKCPYQLLENVPKKCEKKVLKIKRNVLKKCLKCKTVLNLKKNVLDKKMPVRNILKMQKKCP